MKALMQRSRLFRFALGIGLVTVLATNGCSPNTVSTESVLAHLGASPLSSPSTGP